MRAAMVVAVFVPLLLLAGEPKVTAPISSGDVQQICELVASVTSDRIITIGGVLSNECRSPRVISFRCGRYESTLDVL
jgi:hypothetical protein